MRKLMLTLVVFGASLTALAAIPSKANAWWGRWGVGYYAYPSYYYPGAYSSYYGYPSYYSGYYTPAYSSFYYGYPSYYRSYYAPAYSSYYYPGVYPGVYMWP
jgi:hypothetical protein